VTGALDTSEPLAPLVPPDLRELLRTRNLVLSRPVWGRRFGRHRSARAGVGLDFRDHRPYVPGDDPRRLDWRAVARRERLVLRQTEAEDELSLCVVFDSSGGMAYGQGDALKIRTAWAIAGGLAWLAARQGDPVGLAIGGDGEVAAHLARPASGHERLAALARRLSAHPVRGLCPWDALLADVSPRLPRRSLTVVISDFLDPSGTGDEAAERRLLRGLGHLRARKHDVVLVQVLHRDEVEFPWRERAMLRFLDLRGLRKPLEGAGQALRDRYLARFTAHQRDLEARCEADGLFLETVITDEPLPGLFVALLGRIAGDHSVLPEVRP
jgi:uncharacterized protein (DUF58 family)